MSKLLKISFHHKNHFIRIHFHFIDDDSMLQVFPESLHFMCVDCVQPYCNPSWNPVNGDKC